MSYVAKTLMTGTAVYFNALTIEEIAEWAEFHNLVYGEPKVGCEVFSVHTSDSSPLPECAVARLKQWKWQSTQTGPATHPGIGLESKHAAQEIVRALRDSAE